jgi:hypothetical protein
MRLEYWILRIMIADGGWGVKEIGDWWFLPRISRILRIGLGGLLVCWLGSWFVGWLGGWFVYAVTLSLSKGLRVGVGEDGGYAVVRLCGDSSVPSE